MAIDKKNEVVRQSSVRIPEFRAKTDTFLYLRSSKNDELQRVIVMSDMQIGLKDTNYPPKGLIFQSRAEPASIQNKLYNKGGSLHFSGQPLLSGTVAVSLDQVDLSANGGTVSGDSQLTFTAIDHVLSLEAGNNVTLTGDSASRKVTVTSAGASAGGSDTELQYNNGGIFGGVSSLTFNDSSGDVTIIDDKKLQFGTSGDGHIEYNEDGDNYLVVSSSNIVFSGSTVFDGGSFFLGAASDVGADVSIFVTGTAHSKNGNTGGTTLFAGDVAVSGTLYVDRMVIELDEVYTGSLSISGSLFVSQSATIHEGLTVNEAGEGGPENDFRVESENFTHALFVDTSTDQVLILSGGSDTSPNESSYTDANFFVSGSIDSRGTSTKGTSVFGGDVVVSGTLSVNRSDAGGYSMVTVTTDGKVGIGTDAPGNKLSVGGNMDLGEYLYHKNDQDTFIQFEDDTIHMEAGGRSFIKLTEAGTDKLIVNNGALDIDLQVKGANAANLFRTDAANDSIYFGANSAAGDDNNFWVSGSIGSRDSITDRGTAVFGGDVVISGSIFPGSDSEVNLGSETSRFANIYTGDLHLRNERGNWTIVEEADHLTVINNTDGKKYKMVLEPLDE